MKNIAILFTLLFLVGCQSEVEDVTQIREKLADNRKEIKKLKKENTKLEKELIKYVGNEQEYKIPVVVFEVKPTVFKNYIQANGMVEAVESAMISPETGGQIKKIHVKEGDYVKKGDLLVSLNTSVLMNSIAEVKKGLELATKVYEKQKSLWESKIGSEIEFLQAENNKESLEQKLKTLNAQLDLFIINAPFSGIVDQIISKEGELGAPGMPILQLVNLNAIKVKADVSERYIPSIKVGDKVNVCFPTYPDLCMEEKIFRTSNVIHKDNRTFTVELRMKNIDNMLKPNMMAVIDINDYTRENSIIVPSSIIKNDLKGKFLFKVVKSEDKYIAEKVEVETGRSYDGNTLILKGLNPGDKVIVKGYNTVTTGTEVTLN